MDCQLRSWGVWPGVLSLVTGSVSNFWERQDFFGSQNSTNKQLVVLPFSSLLFHTIGNRGNTSPCTTRNGIFLSLEAPLKAVSTTSCLFFSSSELCGTWQKDLFWSKEQACTVCIQNCSHLTFGPGLACCGPEDTSGVAEQPSLAAACSWVWWQREQSLMLQLLSALHCGSWLDADSALHWEDT